MADTRDLKSLVQFWAYGFESRLRQAEEDRKRELERRRAWERRTAELREWSEKPRDAPRPPHVAPAPVAAPLVAPPVPREPAAPVVQSDAKGRKPTFVQTEFWE